MASVRKVSWTHKGVTKQAWQVTYTDPATGKRPTKNFAAKKIADAYRLKVEREIEDGVHTAAVQTKTVREVCDAFMEHLELKKKEGRISPERIGHFALTFRLHLFPRLGVMPFANLRVPHVEDFYAYLTNERGMKPYVARQRIGMLKQVEDFAVRREWTKRTVAQIALQDLRGIERDEQKRFETEQALTLLRFVAGRPKHTTERAAAVVRCFVNLAAFCALRFGEIRALRPEDLDFATGTIRVRFNLTASKVHKTTKTKAGVREVPMPSHVALLLRDWIATHQLPHPKGYLFTTTTGNYQGHAGFHDMWHRTLDAIGLKPPEGEDYHHFHALRGFAASWWEYNGVPLTTIAKWMGHAKPDVTLQFYARSLVTKTEQRELADRLAVRLLSPTQTIDAVPVMDTTRAREQICAS